jgi:hypothetical protein
MGLLLFADDAREIQRLALTMLLHLLARPLRAHGDAVLYEVRSLGIEHVAAAKTQDPCHLLSSSVKDSIANDTPQEAHHQKHIC